MVLPLDQGPASGHTREEPAVSRGGHGALRPCSRLWSLFPPWAGVGRCPSPGHTRVTSLSVEVLFKVSTMRSSTPVRPHAPCLRQSSQKNQYHYGSQCTTQLCPQIKTPSVSATLLSRLWDSLGCVDALGVRSASDRVGPGLPRRPPLRSPAPRWVGRGWASGDRGTRVWRRLSQGWPGRRTRPCSPCTAHCQAGPLHRQRRCWGRRGPPCPSRGDMKVAVAVATRPAARESGRSARGSACSALAHLRFRSIPRCARPTD